MPRAATLSSFLLLSATSAPRSSWPIPSTRRLHDHDADTPNSLQTHMQPYLWKTRADGVNVLNIGKTWYVETPRAVPAPQDVS